MSYTNICIASAIVVACHHLEKEHKANGSFVINTPPKNHEDVPLPDLDMLRITGLANPQLPHYSKLVTIMQPSIVPTEMDVGKRIGPY